MNANNLTVKARQALEAAGQIANALQRHRPSSRGGGQQRDKPRGTSKAAKQQEAHDIHFVILLGVHDETSGLKAPKYNNFYHKASKP